MAWPATSSASSSAGSTWPPITCPVRTFHGSLDEISPPEVGTWLVARLPNAVLDLSPEAGHHLLFPRWRGILRALRRDAGM